MTTTIEAQQTWEYVIQSRRLTAKRGVPMFAAYDVDWKPFSRETLTFPTHDEALRFMQNSPDVWNCDDFITKATGGQS